MKPKKEDVFALFLLIGTIVGAGVLGLPKAMQSVGLWPSLALLAVGFVAVYLLALMIADLSSSLKEKVHLPALIGEFFAEDKNIGKLLAFITLFTVLYAALTAYIIGSGEQLNALLGLDKGVDSLLFYILAVVPVALGLVITAEVSTAIGLIMLFALLALVGMSLGFFNFENLNTGFGGVGALTAFFSLSLFALFGHNVLPEVVWLLKKEREKVKRVALCGFLVPLIAYILFMIVVAGAVGNAITEVGTVALAGKIGGTASLFISLFALAALYTSFLGIALSIRDAFLFDFNLEKMKWGKALAVILAVLPPLLLYLANAMTFLEWIGSVGGLILNLFVVLVALTFWKALKEGRVKAKFTPMPEASAIFLAVLYGLNFLLGLQGLLG